MPRLFRNGVPCDAGIVEAIYNPGTFGMSAHHLEFTSLNDVTIVSKGHAWRALRKKFHSQGRNIRIECTLLRTTPEVQEMLLADMLLS